MNPSQRQGCDLVWEAGAVIWIVRPVHVAGSQRQNYLPASCHRRHRYAISRDFGPVSSNALQSSHASCFCLGIALAIFVGSAPNASPLDSRRRRSWLHEQTRERTRTSALSDADEVVCAVSFFAFHCDPSLHTASQRRSASVSLYEFPESNKLPKNPE